MNWMLTGQLFVAFSVGIIFGVVASLAADRRYSGLDSIVRLFTMAVLISYISGAVVSLLMTAAFR